jgi:hypothetical protein
MLAYVKIYSEFVSPAFHGTGFVGHRRRNPPERRAADRGSPSGGRRHGRHPRDGPAKKVAKAFVESVEGNRNGETLGARSFAESRLRRALHAFPVTVHASRATLQPSRATLDACGAKPQARGPRGARRQPRCTRSESHCPAQANDDSRVTGVSSSCGSRFAAGGRKRPGGDWQRAPR